MANPYFSFKQFTVYHDRSAMKVTTDACLFGAWTAHYLEQHGKVNGHMLDIGTGTGLLSLMAAQKTKASIEAVELDHDAASQAAENVKASPWKESIRVLTSDIRDLQPATKYAVIFSNPPFYENELSSSIKKKNLAHHGEGLPLGELLEWIRLHLAEDGIFFLLLPAKRWKEIQQMLVKNQLHIHQITWVRQTPKHDPFRLMIRGAAFYTDRITEEISVRDLEDHYTAEFTGLLKDYYLYL